MRGALAEVIGEIGRDKKGRPWRVEFRQGADNFPRYGLAYQDKKGWHAEQYGRTYATVDEVHAQFDKEWKCPSTPLASSSTPSPSPSPLSEPPGSPDTSPDDPDEDELVLSVSF